MVTDTEKSRKYSSLFLLDHAKARPSCFAALHPRLISSVASLRGSLPLDTGDSLWISYAHDLTEALIKSAWPASSSLGQGLFIHPLDAATIPPLSSRFRRIAFITDGGFLPAEELAEALMADHRGDLFLGGSVDHATETITLWRGDLKPLVVPFSAFEASGDGTRPDFRQFAVIDSGQTIRLGEYEAAADALLYDYDPDYRRRISAARRAVDRTFGAALRRLRKQRGLRREDFEPDLSAKTIARIEQNKVRRLHKQTLAALGKHLAVDPGEIGSY